ncbi:hypothetical protein [Thermincola ferriacetica]
MLSKLGKSNLLYFFAITLVGIIFRMIWVFKIPNQPVSDFKGYYNLALSIYRGISLYQAGLGWQGMGYPVILGFFFRLIGHAGILTAKGFNVFISSCTLVIFYFAIKKMTDRISIVFMAYTILALLPNYIAYNNVLGTEVLVNFFLAGIVAIQVHDIRKLIKYPLLGITIAFAALTKPYFLVYPVVLAVIEWFKVKNLTQTGAMFLVVLLFMAIVIAPWTYRNYLKFGRFIPVSYNSGIVLFINNNDVNAWGGWIPVGRVTPSPELVKAIEAKGSKFGDIKPELEPLYKNKAKQWIMTHPLEFMKLGFMRLKNTFFSGAQDIEKWAMSKLNLSIENFRTLKVFLGISDIIIYCLSVLGFIFVIFNVKTMLASFFKKEKRISYLISVPTINILFFSAIFFVFEGQPRYNFPVLFFLVLSAVLCLESIRIHSFSGWGSQAE